MAPKRKHVASPTAPTPEAGPSAKKSRAGLNAQSTNSTADDDNDNNHSYKVEAEWELVGTDKKYTRFIGESSQMLAEKQNEQTPTTPETNSVY